MLLVLCTVQTHIATQQNGDDKFGNTVRVCCAGRQVADDIGFDGTGHSSTDPAAILQGGAIRPFDRCLRCCRSALGSYILIAPNRAVA